MSLLTAKFVKNSHYGRIYFIFLKNVVKETWNAFNTKFWPHWKDWKNSYQERQTLSLFCNLIDSSLGRDGAKDRRATKIVKKISLKESGAS